MSLFTLKKNKEFRRVFNTGKSVADRYLVMYVLPERECAANKFGFSISKKVGNAVCRNRIRRKLKEICRLNLINLKKGLNIILIARNPIVGLNYANLEKSFLGLAKRAKVYVPIRKVGEYE